MWITLENLREKSPTHSYVCIRSLYSYLGITIVMYTREAMFLTMSTEITLADSWNCLVFYLPFPFYKKLFMNRL
jgi:hypothetical protein